MLRMRGGGCDRRISLGGANPLFRESGRVIEVNEVMRDAGMPRLPREDRLQQRRALELIGIGLVSRRGRYIERDAVQYLRFVIISVAGCQSLHRLEICLDAPTMRHVLVIGV